jgi:GNAT superfamily N-acetyltransferase
MSVASSDQRGAIVRVTYLELRAAPTPLEYGGPERIELECMTRSNYLWLYRRVGASVLWDQRLAISPDALDSLLAGDALAIYVLRGGDGKAIGFCEFDRQGFPDIELKNFGLIPAAQGRGLGSWLLSVALQAQWQSGANRIWLHTDTWDHPAAVKLYERAGFRVFDVRDELAGPL